MGKFIESLRLRPRIQGMKIDASKRVRREVESILREDEKLRIKEDQELQERTLNKCRWEEARDRYNESGLSGILREMVESGKATGSRENLSGDFDKEDGKGKKISKPYFYADLVITENSEYSRINMSNGRYEDKITTKYVVIRTYKDGTVSFYGKRHLFDREGSVIAKVPKAKWKKDRKVLEDALRKTCSRPLVSKKLISGRSSSDDYKGVGGGG